MMPDNIADTGWLRNTLQTPSILLWGKVSHMHSQGWIAVSDGTVKLPIVAGLQSSHFAKNGNSARLLQRVARSRREKGGASACSATRCSRQVGSCGDLLESRLL